MSGEYEYDPYEYAEELAAGEDLGHSDLARDSPGGGRPRGLSRRELLVRGGAAAAAVGGLRCVRRLGRRREDRSSEVDGRQVHRHAAGSHPRRRVPDPGHREAGVQGPGLHREADPRRLGEAAADRDHVAGHVRRLRRLQLPVASRLAVRRTAAGRHDARSRPGTRFYKLFAHGKLNPASASCTFGDGNAPFRTTFVDTDGSTGPARRSTVARRTTSRSFAGSARTASRSAASRSPATSSARRPTSTPTRWATTPT